MTSAFLSAFIKFTTAGVVVEASASPSQDPRVLTGKLPPSSFSHAGWAPECCESAAAPQRAHHLEGWGELRRGPSYFLALVCGLQGTGVNEDRGWPPPNGPLKVCG